MAFGIMLGLTPGSIGVHSQLRLRRLSSITRHLEGTRTPAAGFADSLRVDKESRKSIASSKAPLGAYELVDLRVNEEGALVCSSGAAKQKPLDLVEVSVRFGRDDLTLVRELGIQCSVQKRQA